MGMNSSASEECAKLDVKSGGPAGAIVIFGNAINREPLCGKLENREDVYWT